MQSILAQASTSNAVADLFSSFSSFSPILNLGLGGVLVFLIIKRIGIEPTYVYKDAKDEWERERAEMQSRFDAERASWVAERARIEVERTREREKAEKDDAAKEATIGTLTTTIVDQVVPAVTRVAGPLLDLVRMKEEEERRDEVRRDEQRRILRDSGEHSAG